MWCTKAQKSSLNARVLTGGAVGLFYRFLLGGYKYTFLVINLLSSLGIERDLVLSLFVQRKKEEVILLCVVLVGYLLDVGGGAAVELR